MIGHEGYLAGVVVYRSREYVEISYGNDKVVSFEPSNLNDLRVNKGQPVLFKLAEGSRDRLDDIVIDMSRVPDWTYRGRIINFNPDRGIGNIMSSRGMEVFFHTSDVTDSGLVISKKVFVDYEVVLRDRSLRAVNIRKRN